MFQTQTTRRAQCTATLAALASAQFPLADVAAKFPTTQIGRCIIATRPRFGSDWAATAPR